MKRLVIELTELSAELLKKARQCRTVAPGLSYRFYRQSEVCKLAAEELKETKKGGDGHGAEGNACGD